MAASLQITSVENGLLKIERRAEISDTQWSLIYSFWTNSVPSSSDNSFTVPIAEFETRRAWLDLMKRRGVIVDVRPEVLEKLNTLRSKFGQFERLALLVDLETLPELDLTDVRRPLTDEQIHNMACLLRMEAGSNFSVPGAGKTATQLVLWRQLQRRGTVEKMLVVAPKSAFDAWEGEQTTVFSNPPHFEVFNGRRIDFRTEIAVVNYEQLEDSDRCRYLCLWLKSNKGLLVLDEAHRVKGGPKSVRWNSCKRLSDASIRVDLLTGTPRPNGDEDLRNLLELSWGPRVRQWLTSSRIQNLERNGVFVRTTKDELDLPPLAPKSVAIEMGDVQRQIYSALCRSYLGQFRLNSRDALSFGRRGRAALTLIAAASNIGLLLRGVSEDAYMGMQWPPRVIYENPELLDVLQKYVRYEMPPKYDWVLRLVTDRAEKGEKVLVWSTFVGNLLALKRVLSNFDPALVHGATPHDERKFELKRFRESSLCNVLLTNPQTLGEGISLHDCCHTAIYLDRSYNAGLYLQSLDRIHRLGLPPDTKTDVYILESNGSIDLRVGARLDTKIRALAQILSDAGLGTTSIPTELEDGELVDLLESFDANELFDHLREISG